MLPWRSSATAPTVSLRTRGTKLVRHLQVALLLGFAQALDFALDDQVVVGTQLDAVLLGEALGALANEIYMRAFGEDLLGGADGIADVLHATHATGAQGGAVHHQRVKLHPAVHVKERAAAGVEGLVLLHRDHGCLDRVEATAAALQHLPALRTGSFHSADVRLDVAIGNCPRSAMDQQYRIDRQSRTFLLRMCFTAETNQKAYQKEGGRPHRKRSHVCRQVDMRRTCKYAEHMSRMIQLRNVPDALHRI